MIVLGEADHWTLWQLQTRAMHRIEWSDSTPSHVHVEVQHHTELL